MYIGSKSILRLKSFLDGYSFAAMDFDIEERGQPEFGAFHDWVARKFGWYESTLGWPNIILQETGHDESAAVDHFYQLLDEFRSEVAGRPGPAPDPAGTDDLTDSPEEERQRHVIADIAKRNAAARADDRSEEIA
jgi:hypothetical protein